MKLKKSPLLTCFLLLALPAWAQTSEDSSDEEWTPNNDAPEWARTDLSPNPKTRKEKLENSVKKYMYLENGSFYSIYSKKGVEIKNKRRNKAFDPLAPPSPDLAPPAFMTPSKQQTFETHWASKFGMSMEAYVKSKLGAIGWARYQSNPLEFIVSNNPVFPKTDLYDDPESPFYFNPSQVPVSPQDWYRLNILLSGPDGANQWHYLRDVSTHFSRTGQVQPTDGFHRTKLAETINWQGIDTSKLNLSSLNISKSNLSAAQIAASPNITASNLSGKDLTGVNFSGKNLSSVNLSNVTGITGYHLNGAILSYTTLKGIDLTDLATDNRDLRGVSFIGTNITPAQLNQARDLRNVRLDRLNLTGFKPNTTDLSGAILFGSTGIKGEDLNGVTNFSGANLRNINLAGLSLAGKNFSGATLTGAQGITISELNNATLNPAPENYGKTWTALGGFDLQSLDTSGRNLSYYDVRGSTLTANQLSGATSFKEAILSNVKVTGGTPDFSGKDLSGANLFRITGFTGAALNNAQSLEGATLSMNLQGFDATGKSLKGVNLSGSQNFQPTMINNASDLTGVNFTNLKNLQGLETQGKNLSGAVFTSSNLTANQLAAASNISNVTVSSTRISKAQLEAALTAAGKDPQLASEVVFQ